MSTSYEVIYNIFDENKFCYPSIVRTGLGISVPRKLRAIVNYNSIIWEIYQNDFVIQDALYRQIDLNIHREIVSIRPYGDKRFLKRTNEWISSWGLSLCVSPDIGANNIYSIFVGLYYPALFNNKIKSIEDKYNKWIKNHHPQLHESFVNQWLSRRNNILRQVVNA